MRQKLNQCWRMAESLNKLGEVAYRRRQYHAARRNYQESLAILRDFGERERLASTLMLYGEVCTDLEENDAAKQAWLESLRIAREIGVDGIAVKALLGLAALQNTDGRRELSVEILAGIIEHPSFDQADKEKVANLLAELQAGLAPPVYQASMDAGKLKSLDDLAKDMLKFDERI